MTQTGGVIGSIETFHRKAVDEMTGEPRDVFHDTAILRMDIRSDYEDEAMLLPLIHLILETAYDDFACDCIATKAPHIARERRKALKKAGFAETEAILPGLKGEVYGDYFIRTRSGC